MDEIVNWTVRNALQEQQRRPKQELDAIEAMWQAFLSRWIR